MAKIWRGHAHGRFDSISGALVRALSQPIGNLIRNVSSAPPRFGRAAQTAMLAAGVGLLLASPAWAAGGGTAMPWEGPLTTVMQSLSGPVAKAIGIIAIVLTGLGFAFAEGGSAMRKGIGIRE